MVRVFSPADIARNYGVSAKVARKAITLAYPDAPKIGRTVAVTDEMIPLVRVVLKFQLGIDSLPDPATDMLLPEANRRAALRRSCR